MGAAYNPAQQLVKDQIPQTQALYDTLIQALQTQAGTETQGILDSAARRGVERASLAQDVGSTLDNAALLEQARLNASRVGNLADITGSLTDLGVNRATGAVDLGGTLQESGIASQRNALELSKMQKRYEIDRQKVDRQYELDLTRAKRAAAARAAKSGGLPSEVSDEIQSTLAQVRGADGNVSPQDYKDMLQVWVASGGSVADYHNKFKSLVNLQHPQDYYNLQGNAPVRKKQSIKRGGGRYSRYT